MLTSLWLLATDILPLPAGCCMIPLLPAEYADPPMLRPPAGGPLSLLGGGGAGVRLGKRLAGIKPGGPADTFTCRADVVEVCAT